MNRLIKSCLLLSYFWMLFDSTSASCNRPTISSNGRIIELENNTDENFPIGFEINVECDDGYKLFEQNATRVCVQNGHWSGEQIECFETNEFSDNNDVTHSVVKTFTLLARSMFTSSSKTNYRNSNIFFVIDISERIPAYQHNTTKEFIKLIVQKYCISSVTTRVGVISFNSEASLELSPNETDVNSIINYIEQIQQTADNGSNIVKALNKLLEILTELKLNSVRADSKSVIFLISDGNITDGGNPVEVVRNIKQNHNVVIHAIAIGSEQNRDLLKTITPNVLMFSNHKIFFTIIRKTLAKKEEYNLCGVAQDDGEFASSLGRNKSKHLLSSIVGGSKVERSWPWMVAVYHTAVLDLANIAIDPETNEPDITENPWRKVFCGGTIIHKDWVLSAGHCFSCDAFSSSVIEHPYADQWRVVAGRIDVTDLHSGLLLSMDKIYCHPNYKVTRKLYDYDLALLKLATYITFDQFIRPICLPPSYEDLPNDTKLYKTQEMATAIGWGILRGWNIMNSDSSDFIKDPARIHLHEVDIPIQSDETCQKPISYSYCPECENITLYPTNRMMCAGGGDTDTCDGDSGGPLMQRAPTIGDSYSVARWFLTGVVSWGIGCAQKDLYGYYAHVARLRDFVDNVTQLSTKNSVIVDAI